MDTEKVKAYILARLKETSTYVGIIGIAVGLGMHIAPEQQVAILKIGILIAAFLHAVTPE